MSINKDKRRLRIRKSIRAKISGTKKDLEYQYSKAIKLYMLR